MGPTFSGPGTGVSSFCVSSAMASEVTDGRVRLQMNLHGAKDRPILSEVWSKIVEPKLDGQRAKIDESRIGTTTAFGTLKGKIFG